MRAIFSERLARPVGPFSPAIRSAAKSHIFVSGQIAESSATSKLIDGGVEAQTEQAFANLGAVLEASGRSFADVLRATVYLTDIADFAAMNAIYGKFFKPPYPARTTIAVAALPLGARVEIDAIVRGDE
jgi:2-iminobutanoate/2-iminopropanoate deaminase